RGPVPPGRRRRPPRPRWRGRARASGEKRRTWRLLWVHGHRPERGYNRQRPPLLKEPADGRQAEGLRHPPHSRRRTRPHPRGLRTAAARRVVEGHDYSRSGQWKTWEPLGHLGQDLVGRTLGVVGMGRIGYALAKRCARGWDMPVLYHDVYRNEKAETELGAR